MTSKKCIGHIGNIKTAGKDYKEKRYALLFPLHTLPMFSFPALSLEQDRKWNKPCKPLNTSAFFNFWKRRVIRIKPMIFNTVEKKSYSFCCSVLIQDLGAICISHPEVGHKLAAAAVHQPGSNKKIHSKQAFTYEHLYSPGDWNHP